MSTSNNTDKTNSQKPPTVGSQNPSASKVSAKEWKDLKDRLAITTAGARGSARGADTDDDGDDDTMSIEQAAAAKRSAQKSTKRIPSGPSVPSRKT